MFVAFCKECERPLFIVCDSEQGNARESIESHLARGYSVGRLSNEEAGAAIYGCWCSPIESEDYEE
jgi:hypothetical protein